MLVEVDVARPLDTICHCELSASIVCHCEILSVIRRRTIGSIVVVDVECDAVDLTIGANVDFLEPMTPEDVAEMLEEVSDKYSEMQVLHANVHLKRHKEEMRGNPLILAKVILHTNQGQFVVKGEGYGPDNALRIARDKLERRVLSAKGVSRKDRDAERLFKDLGL